MRSFSMNDAERDRGTPRSVNPAPMECLIRVTCEPGANFLDSFQGFVTAYCSQKFRPSVAERVALASYELFSNGIAYGSISTQVTYELFNCGDTLMVRVSNAAIRSRVAMLKDQLARLEAGAKETYIAEMQRSVAGVGRSAMLGLARLYHEAEMRVSLEEHGEHLKLSASCRS